MTPAAAKEPTAWRPYFADSSALPRDKVRPPAACTSKARDTLLLCVALPDGQAGRAALRAIVHVRYGDGQTIPYDETVPLDHRPKPGNAPQSRCFVIAGGAEVREVTLAANARAVRTGSPAELSFHPAAPFKLTVR